MASNFPTRRHLSLQLSRALKTYTGKKNSAPEDKKDDFLTVLRNFVFFLAVYLYFIGWTYFYYFYSHFGVSIYSLDIPVYYFFVYSYSVILANFWWFVCAAGIFTAVIFILRDRKDLRKLFTVVLLLITFPLSFKMAKRTAFHSGILLRQGFGQTANLVFKDPSVPSRYPALLVEANNNGGLRLLTQTKDKVFVIFQPSDDTPGSELPMCFTYILSGADVLVTTVEAQNIPDVRVEEIDIPR